jgi:hypothetical protein
MSSILSARNSVAKTERGFCSSARAEKKPLSIFKIVSVCPEIRLEEDMVKQAKMVKIGESGFLAGKKIPDPPPPPPPPLNVERPGGSGIEPGSLI